MWVKPSVVRGLVAIVGLVIFQSLTTIKYMHMQFLVRIREFNGGGTVHDKILRFCVTKVNL